MLSGSTSATSPRRATRPPESAVVRGLADSLIAVLLAPGCAACARPLERPTLGPVCAPCWRAVVSITPPFCAHCGDPMATWRVREGRSDRCPRCRRAPSAIALARAVGPYDGSLRAILHAFKYGTRQSLAAPLAQLMTDVAGPLLEGVEVVVPVPLHWRRRRQRGFNQAEALARRLGRPWQNAIRRTRSTPSQTDLPAAQRHRNVRDAFALRRRADVSGRVVLVVDDVSTTGATLEACARVLRAAGALEVRALTVARVVTRAP
ncbi:MAG: ComF family protein [Vicinamibacterales bacterium]